MLRTRQHYKELQPFVRNLIKIFLFRSRPQYLVRVYRLTAGEGSGRRDTNPARICLYSRQMKTTFLRNVKYSLFWGNSIENLCSCHQMSWPLMDWPPLVHCHLSFPYGTSDIQFSNKLIHLSPHYSILTSQVYVCRYINNTGTIQNNFNPSSLVCILPGSRIVSELGAVAEEAQRRSVVIRVWIDTNRQYLGPVHLH